ncbi:MAG: Mur ligase family protein [Candidatus Omnitrophota bacterium]
MFSFLIKVGRIYRRTLIAGTKVIVVVGSLGKTTTTGTISTALGCAGRRVSYSNYGSSLAENLLSIKPWDRFGVLEAGISRPGMMGANAYLTRPDIVVVTSIKLEHFRSFSSPEETRNEKVKILTGLTPTGTAVLNGDDPHVLWMASQTKAQIVTYGFGENCMVRAMDVQYIWPEGMTVRIRYQDQEWEVKTRLLGRHFVYPLLSSVAVAIICKYDVSSAIKNLESMPPSKSRFELIPLDNDVKVIDDTYKGGIDTFDSALDMFAKVRAQRKLMICGNIEDPPGNSYETYRRLGQYIGQTVDKVLLVGGMELEKTRAGFVGSGKDRSDAVYIKNDVYQAIELIRGMIQPGDVILVKGRGTQRLHRIVLALRQIRVTCPVKICNVKVHTCDECPMLDKEQADFQNRFILPYIKK